MCICIFLPSIWYYPFPFGHRGTQPTGPPSLPFWMLRLPPPDKNARCSVNSRRDSFAGESLKNSESVALDSTPKKILVRSLYVRQSCFIHTGTKPLSDEMWHGAHLRKTASTCSKGQAGRRTIVTPANLSGIDQ